MINKTMKKPAAFLLAASMLTSIFSGNVYAAEVLEDTTEVVADAAISNTDNEIEGEHISEIGTVNGTETDSEVSYQLLTNDLVASNLDGASSSIFDVERNANDSSTIPDYHLYTYKAGKKGYQIVNISGIRGLANKLWNNYNGHFSNSFDNHALTIDYVIDGQTGKKGENDVLLFTYYKYNSTRTSRSCYRYYMEINTGKCSDLSYTRSTLSPASNGWDDITAGFDAPLYTSNLDELAINLRSDKPKPSKYLKFKKNKYIKNDAKVKTKDIAEEAVDALHQFEAGLKCINMSSSSKKYHFDNSYDWRVPTFVHLELLTTLIPKTVLLYVSGPTTYPLLLDDYAFCDGYSLGVFSSKPCVDINLNDNIFELVAKSKGSSTVQVNINNLSFKVKVKVKK